MAGLGETAAEDTGVDRSGDAAYQIGLGGLVSKHRERAYRGGRCYHWVKVKNRKHPAYSRVAGQF